MIEIYERGGRYWVYIPYTQEIQASRSFDTYDEAVEFANARSEETGMDVGWLGKASPGLPACRDKGNAPSRRARSFVRILPGLGTRGFKHPLLLDVDRNVNSVKVSDLLWYISEGQIKSCDEGALNETIKDYLGVVSASGDILQRSPTGYAKVVDSKKVADLDYVMERWRSGMASVAEVEVYETANFRELPAGVCKMPKKKAMKFGSCIYIDRLVPLGRIRRSWG